MKKSHVLKSLLLALGLSIFTGCSFSEPTPSEQDRVKFEVEELKGAPKWVMNPNIPGYYAEIGSAKRNSGGDISFQRQEAITVANANLARKIQNKVSSMFKTYKGKVGYDKNGTYDATSSFITKQVSNLLLSNTYVEDTWLNSQGTFFVLLKVKAEDTDSFIQKNIISQLTPEQREEAKNNSKEAFIDLDNQ